MTGGDTVRFMGLDLLVADDVLRPREETELLARTAVAEIPALGDRPLVIDMCCGSGNLACAIAAALPGARVLATDLTTACVELARRNVDRLRLGDRVQVFQGDLFEAFRDPSLQGTVDAVVCNPPYISTGRLETELSHLLDGEPREAFDGGPYGLTIQQRVTREALAYLRPGGLLMFEIGAGQERQIKALYARAGGYEGVSCRQDSSGVARVAVGQKR